MKYRYELIQDQDPRNPRDCDNLGTMVCWHRRYILGDEQPNESPEEWIRNMSGLDDDKKYISLPLYLYDHGGITMSCAAFSCPWDSGQVGIIYVSKERLRQEYSSKLITPKIREKALSVLRAEVEEYDRFLAGDCWGYEIYEMDDDPDMIAAGYEDGGYCVDSCWGFLGHEWAEQAAQEAMDYYVQKDAENPQQAVLFPDGNETAHIRAAYA
jgi:hypothetical protein